MKIHIEASLAKLEPDAPDPSRLDSTDPENQSCSRYSLLPLTSRNADGFGPDGVLGSRPEGLAGSLS